MVNPDLIIKCNYLLLYSFLSILIHFFIKTYSPYPVLIISMDGFRHDYIELVKKSGTKLPNFDYLIKEGTRIMRLKSNFPTVTLPNHQTLLTGLYPENHGVVFNRFVDKSFPNENFDMNNQDTLNDKKWFENWPEPIWVTLEHLGYLTASHLWPLTDSSINGKLPFFQESQYLLLNYPNISFNYYKRVEDVVRWLSETRIHIDFSMLYFPEPDETGHFSGPNSQQVINIIKKLDSVLGNLIKLLTSENIWNKINIILTADHGMSDVSESRYIYLDDYVDSKLYTFVTLTPVAGIYPILGKKQEIYKSLKNKNSNMEVFWRYEVPKSLNFNLDNGRIPPIVIIARNQWSIAQNRSSIELLNGDHGYDHDELDSQSFFIAQGPNIRRNVTIPFGHSVDVYPLLCYLMGINPRANNGSFDRIKDVIQFRLIDNFTHLIFSLKLNLWLLDSCCIIAFVILLVAVVSRTVNRKPFYIKTGRTGKMPLTRYHVE